MDGKRTGAGSDALARGSRTGGRRRPKKLSASYLENSALYYLQRYSASVAQVRRVMLRKVERSLAEHGGDREEALAWLEALLAKLVRNGLLDDTAYATSRTRSLRASGQSARLIAQKLRMKGLAEPLVKEALREASDELPEEEAARIWARKRRRGPYRRDPEARRENRERDLAALGRAGFSFEIARRVIDARTGGDGELRESDAGVRDVEIDDDAFDDRAPRPGR